MILKTMLCVVLLAAPVGAEVVRIEVKSRADVLAGQAVRHRRSLREALRHDLLRRRSAQHRQPDHRRHRQGAEERRRQGGVLVRLLPDQAEGPEPRQRHAPLRSVQPRRQGHDRVLQPCAAGSLDPQTAEQFGDGFLLEQGFTLLWVGWQFDPPLRDGLVRVYAPIAREADGRSDSGPGSQRLRSACEPTTQASLADRDHLAYAVANADDPANVLTVRDSVEGPRRTIPRDQWQFTEDGKGDPHGRGLRARRRSTKWSTGRRIRRSSAWVPPRCGTRSRG